MRPSTGWRKAWPITPIRAGSELTRSSVSWWPAAWRPRREPICAPPRSSGWRKGSAASIHYELAGPVRLLADAALAKVRAALDPALFAEAFTAGQQLSLEEAFATILASSSVTVAPALLAQLSA